MRAKRLFICFSIIGLLFQHPFFAGKQKLMAGPPPFARVKSPELNKDGSITFRIWAPKASEVKLQCAALLGEQSDQMERFNEEYWRITVKPVRSGKFRYKFLVDGVQTPDPVNSLTIGTSSVVLVPGKETEFFKVRNVPHGTVHRHFYHNPAIEAVRSVSVYTPPGYEDYHDQAWTILLLFHGSGGTDESWFRAGHANVILDNLISEGKAQPMIVVAPFGHTVEPGTHGWPFVQEQGNFVQDFINVLMPYLEKHYRISNDPQNRALAGFSMGGYHTLKIGLNNLNQFGNLGSFSWGADQKFFEEHAPHVLNHPRKVKNQIETFFIACGRDDFLFKRSQALDAFLSDRGIEHTFFVTDGGHEMANWRKFLYEYAQLLFQDE
jgi:enterochelin esterase family protein